MNALTDTLMITKNCHI